MSDTYIGWDGHPYPWPPPDGWYLASDGRWWAPGSGPGPYQAAQAAGTGAGAGAGLLMGDTASMPTMRAEPEVTPGASNPYGPPTHASSVRRFSDDPAPLPLTADFDPPAPSAAAAGGAGPNRLLLVAAGVLALLALGAGIVLLNSGNDDPATDDASAAVTTQPTGTAAAPEPTNPDPAATDTTPVTDTTAATDTTPGTDTAPPVDSTLTAQGAQLVADFRALLVANELTSDQLTDLQIQTFGTSFCIFAQESATPADFDGYRQEAIDRTETALDPVSLALVIDVAVTVFCPDEATRLGISV